MTNYHDINLDIRLYKEDRQKNSPKETAFEWEVKALDRNQLPRDKRLLSVNSSRSCLCRGVQQHDL